MEKTKYVIMKGQGSNALRRIVGSNQPNLVPQKKVIRSEHGSYQAVRYVNPNKKKHAPVESKVGGVAGEAKRLAAQHPTTIAAGMLEPQYKQAGKGTEYAKKRARFMIKWAKRLQKEKEPKNVVVPHKVIERPIADAMNEILAREAKVKPKREPKPKPLKVRKEIEKIVIELNPKLAEPDKEFRKKALIKYGVAHYNYQMGNRRRWPRRNWRMGFDIPIDEFLHRVKNLLPLQRFVDFAVPKENGFVGSVAMGKWLFGARFKIQQAGLWKDDEILTKILKIKYPGWDDPKYKRALNIARDEEARFKAQANEGLARLERPKPKPEPEVVERVNIPESYDNVAGHANLSKHFRFGEAEYYRALGGGANTSIILQIKDDGKGVLKPHSGENTRLRSYNLRGPYYVREAACWVLANHLNMTDIVPQTYMRKDPEKGVSSMMEFVEDGYLPDRSPTGDFGNNPKDVLRAALFDYLTENMDRHRYNWMVKGSGKIQLIDNGLSFGNTVHHWDWRQNDEMVFKEKNSLVGSDLINLALGTKENIMKDLKDIGLDEAAINHYKQRVDVISYFVDKKGIDNITIGDLTNKWKELG